jgi:hypothetical protein
MKRGIEPLTARRLTGMQIACASRHSYLRRVVTHVYEPRLDGIPRFRRTATSRAARHSAEEDHRRVLVARGRGVTYLLR